MCLCLCVCVCLSVRSLPEYNVLPYTKQCKQCREDEGTRGVVGHPLPQLESGNGHNSTSKPPHLMKLVLFFLLDALMPKLRGFLFIWGWEGGKMEQNGGEETGRGEKGREGTGMGRERKRERAEGRPVSEGSGRGAGTVRSSLAPGPRGPGARGRGRGALDPPPPSSQAAHPPTRMVLV